MDEPSSASRPGWLDRLTHLLLREPENREDLVEILHVAYERDLLDADALGMIEGVLCVGEMQVRDVMVPRAQMDVVEIGESLANIIAFAMQTGHSRFPVIEGGKDNILGILLAKDLLHAIGREQDFRLRAMLRPAVFIPESKHLNVLLKDFRNNRNHMALVVDEYGGVAGLVTIEDVVEQIVGDIEDEFDELVHEDNLLQDRRGNWRVKGTTPVAELNTVLHTDFSDQEVDTVAGLVMQHCGRLPRRGEWVDVGRLRCQILRADSRRIHLVLFETDPRNNG